MLAVDRPAALATCTLDLEACCATARPADGGATFAVGTYTLVDQQSRTGVLYFFDAGACNTGLQVWPQTAPRTRNSILTHTRFTACCASANLWYLRRKVGTRRSNRLGLLRRLSRAVPGAGRC